MPRTFLPALRAVAAWLTALGLLALGFALNAQAMERVPPQVDTSPLPAPVAPLPVLEEVLVVERRLVLKEEVRVVRTRVTEPASQRVTLRREEIVVEDRKSVV